ncbi:MAG: YceI family protein [Ignavibacteriales bacterium]|nr:YceI family protein [Ignavibacteriales bacterium]
MNFTVPYMMLSDVTGRFHRFDVSVESVKEDFIDAKINVAIQAKSIDTGVEPRDKHLRSGDFFNADVDSILTFKSTKIEKRDGNNLKITGLLTMRGVTKEVTLDAVYKGRTKGYKGMVAGFNASTTINRKEWGLNWNRTIEAGGLLVGEDVTITIAVQLIQNENKI